MATAKKKTSKSLLSKKIKFNKVQALALILVVAVVGVVAFALTHASSGTPLQQCYNWAVARHRNDYCYQGRDSLTFSWTGTTCEAVQAWGGNGVAVDERSQHSYAYYTINLANGRRLSFDPRYSPTGVRYAATPNDQMRVRNVGANDVYSFGPC